MVRALLTLFAALACAGCMRAPGGAARVDGGGPSADSATVALWHMDDSAGDLVRDSGPDHLDGSAGLATRTGFGRYGVAREFVRDADSFVLVPYGPALRPGRAFTIEAWVNPTAFGQYEDTPIVTQWTVEQTSRSWVFAIAGQRLQPPAASLASPGYHLDLVPPNRVGHLLFAFVPAESSVPQSFLSNAPLELSRWTHVAATYDGEVVKLWIDGRLDGQFASRGRIRDSSAPLLMGNLFDVRRLSAFGGSTLRLDPGADRNPYYAFEGSIDEVRLSSVAREDFPTIVGR